MQRDIRQTPTFRETHHLSRSIWPTNSPDINEAQHLQISADGSHALFTGISAESLEQPLTTKVFEVNLATQKIDALTSQPGSEQQAKYSPNGRYIAFLSDHSQAGNLQLNIINRGDNSMLSPPAVNGWIEQLQWSADGSRILLTVAGHGADKGSTQGAVKTNRSTEKLPPWMPDVETGTEAYRWRQAWIYTIVSNSLELIPAADLNIWQAVWCGQEHIAAITSPSPNEEAWYSAVLQLIDIQTGNAELLHQPRDQLACLSASDSGKTIAFVEALGSDRDIIAGNLSTIDIASRQRCAINSHKVDISYTEWLSETQLLIAGHRGFETHILQLKLSETDHNGSCESVWSSSEITSSGRFITASGTANGDCLIIAESFFKAPEIGRISHGQYHSIISFDQGYNAESTAIKSAEQISWTAADGLEIQGWLLSPQDPAPYPTVMDMHGGPVWQWRPHWLGRRLHILMLVKEGYAVFLPNPRGSAGRGQGFSRLVLGDLGGADTYDYLSGIDHLVAQGLADPQRLGVMGHSYGGYMAAWLISHDQRFSAAVLSAPMTNYISQHLLSNISHFVSLFLDDHYKTPQGKYLQRSPVMYAHQVTTPTLNICGALDRCTPAAEATQFHRALLENQVKSVLVNYPQEGHGISGIAERIDYSARILSWIKQHIPQPCELELMLKKETETKEKAGSDAACPD
jgi:dipeptidyl aminopeptidase/acylaminoacyl peptidase